MFTNNYKKNSKTAILPVIISLLVFFIFLAVTIEFYSEYITVKEIGEQFYSVYLKNIATKFLFGIGVFICAFVLISGNLIIARKNLKKLDVERGFLGKNSILTAFSILLSLFLSFNFANRLSGLFLLYKNKTFFNLSDPIFNKDISYYILEREFLTSLTASLIILFAVILTIVIASYILLYLKLGERTFSDLLTTKSVLSHIVILVSVFSIINAAMLYFKKDEILFSEFSTDLFGAGFIDHNILSKFYMLLPYLLVIITALSIFFLLKQKYIKMFVTIASYFLIIVSVNILGVAVNSFYVSPNELSVEKNYIENNIKATKFAYNLDNVLETEYNYNLTANVVKEADEETLGNLRIVDYNSTILATNQIQSLRNYYQFKDMDIGIYNIEGHKKAVLLGARELDINSLDETALNYTNKKFRYTHGYGLTVASLNSVNSKGEPYYYIKDINQENTVEGIPEVTQPRIYFGEFDSENVIVNTKIKELDYPEGTIEKEYTYDGKAGIQLTPFNRLIFALKSADFRMLVSGQITSESKLLLNQNVIERLSTAVPFILFDQDINLIIDEDGSLKWIVDGYTYSNKFPYSQQLSGINYIRNSVKAVVDAYNGDVELYIIDKNDPIINTYDKIYPNLFEKKQLSAYLKTKIKYPEWLFNIQSEIYSKYHVSTAESFYNKNDLYALATEKYADEIKTMQPYYNVLKLGEFNQSEAELVLMIPYTLYNRENMTAWLSVGNEGDNYGKFVAYRFPKDKTVYGPLQVENMIDNHPDISKELTLWNSGGSKVIRGNLLMAPINNAVLYIEPIYLNSDNKASLPELKRVIAVFGDKVYMCESLEEALENVFKTDMDFSGNNDTPKINDEEIININNNEQLIEIYNKLENSFKNGDWNSFGKSMQDFKEYISVIKNNQ